MGSDLCQVNERISHTPLRRYRLYKESDMTYILSARCLGSAHITMAGRLDTIPQTKQCIRRQCSQYPAGDHISSKANGIDVLIHQHRPTVLSLLHTEHRVGDRFPVSYRLCFVYIVLFISPYLFGHRQPSALCISIRPYIPTRILLENQPYKFPFQYGIP